MPTTARRAAWRRPPDGPKASNQEEAHYGHSVASAGDVNADGYADVIVGAPDWDGGLVNEGGAWIYLGDGDGLETTPIGTRYPTRQAPSLAGRWARPAM